MHRHLFTINKSFGAKTYSATFISHFFILSFTAFILLLNAEWRFGSIAGFFNGKKSGFNKESLWYKSVTADNENTRPSVHHVRYKTSIICLHHIQASLPSLPC